MARILRRRWPTKKSVKRTLHLAHKWDGWKTVDSWKAKDGQTVRSQQRECGHRGCSAVEKRIRKR